MQDNKDVLVNSNSQDEVLRQILENTQKTKKYMQWQFYVTIVLVVLPILAMAFVIPSILSNLGSMYGGVLQ
jgi:predicted nucleic acid-binding Zn ribbon protein